MLKNMLIAVRCRFRGQAFNAWLLIAFFAVFLLAPSIAQVFGIGRGNEENRTLAGFPTFTRLKEIVTFTRQADAYVNDRFGFRSQLVYLNSLLRYRIGLSSSKDVVIGKDGWLFYAAERIMEQHTGADIFSPEKLEHWVSQMEANREWLQKRGIAFYILAAPDKNTIYPEKLPDYPRPPGAVTRMDQLVARLRTSTLDFIDPRPVLLAAKQRGVQVYFEGDSHWTQRGAFVAYQLLMTRIRKRFPDVPVKMLADYTSSQNAHPTADLAYLLTLDNDLHYSIERLEPRSTKHRSAISTRVGWPWRVTEVHNDLHDRPRILVMGDSFTDYVLGPSFLSETFRDPVWTHHNLGTFNFNLVREFQPDIVIFQFAERYLHSPLGSPIGTEAALTNGK